MRLVRTNNRLSFNLFLCQVKAVLFTIEAGMAALALQGTYAKKFFQFMHPLHKPPHSLLYMRLLRLLELAFSREYLRLISDNVIWLGSGFAATNSDFYQNPERRESYGCIVANMPAFKYTFEDGRRLFVSQQTLNEGASAALSCQSGHLSQCESVISFKHFGQRHTGKEVGKWLVEQHEAKGLLPQYVGYHCTDGASNAVAAANEYRALTEINQSVPINHQPCLAHQANRSAKYASGTGGFARNANVDLSDVLTKTHAIVARMHRSAARLRVLRDVQHEAKRSSILIPSPSVPTRWDSSNREVTSVNRIMGDLNKAITRLMKTSDKDKLTAKDGSPRLLSEFKFTESDRIILRQFEGGSEPCLLLSKFFQINDATSHETLFVTSAYIAMLRQTSFVMYDDISTTNLTDLTKRKKTQHVISSVHEETEEESERNDQLMQPCIESFRSLYADDMEFRCGLSESRGGARSQRLPVETAMACLLNPMYGGENYLLTCF